jgi:hypothetical protein
MNVHFKMVLSMVRIPEFKLIATQQNQQAPRTDEVRKQSRRNNDHDVLNDRPFQCVFIHYPSPQQQRR